MASDQAVKTSAGRRSIRISGIGRYLPRRIVENAELEQRFDLTPGWIESRTGVKTRHRADVEADEYASAMGARAAEEALDDAGIAGTDLDLILNASGTPEQAIPDGAALIQRELGLERSGIACFSIHATCLSFLVAIDVAANMIESGARQRILIVSTEVGSRGIVGADPKSESLWGDAAAAVVLEASGDEGSALGELHLRTWSQGAELTQIRGGGTRLHPGREGASNEELRFEMNGQGVLQMCLRRAGRFFSESVPGMREDGMRAGAGIDVAITHQPSKSGLAAMERFGIEPEGTVTTLETLGNCVAASIPCTLYEAIRSGKLKRGQRALLFGTGAGLSMASAVLDY